VAVGESDQLLGAVDAHADQHQQAEFVLAEANVDVDAVRARGHFPNEAAAMKCV
jgi:3-hydroxymyristoyl/3-hydroxydecanoyl-(acyl carrier protein) dehydratase